MRIFVAAILALMILSCKKDSAGEMEVPWPEVGLYPLGAAPSTESQMVAIKTVESLDTTSIDVFERPTGLFSDTLAGLPTPIQQLGYSCVGEAIATMISYYTTKLNGSTFTASPSYIWNQLNGGDVRGNISIPAALELVKRQGVSSISAMPRRTHWEEQPSAAVREEALDNKIAEYYRFDRLDLTMMKFFLRKKHPLIFAANVDSGFLKLSSESTLTISGRKLYFQSSGDVLGGHAMLVVGYDDLMGPGGAFKVMNSWGTKWGNGGYVWIDYVKFIGMLSRSGTKPDLFWVEPKAVRTHTPTQINSISYRAKGQVDSYPDKNFGERGFCYSCTNSKPTILDSRVANGSGTGVFSRDISNLTPNSTCYVRAYVFESGVVEYGSIKKLSTGPDLTATQAMRGWYRGTYTNVRHRDYPSCSPNINGWNYFYIHVGTQVGTNSDIRKTVMLVKSIYPSIPDIYDSELGEVIDGMRTIHFDTSLINAAGGHSKIAIGTVRIKPNGDFTPWSWGDLGTSYFKVNPTIRPGLCSGTAYDFIYHLSWLASNGTVHLGDTPPSGLTPVEIQTMLQRTQ